MASRGLSSELVTRFIVACCVSAFGLVGWFVRQENERLRSSLDEVRRDFYASRTDIATNERAIQWNREGIRELSNIKERVRAIETSLEEMRRH